MDFDNHFGFSPFESDEIDFESQTSDAFNNLLPYSDKLDDEAKSWLLEIKTNLSRAAMLREIQPGCTFWANHLTRYIDVYGLKFSKEDHVAFIHLMYELLTIPNLDPKSIETFASTLHKLIKKKYLLTQDDLVLQWRPLYELILRLMKLKGRNFGYYKSFACLKQRLIYLAENARFYFPETATQEILDIIKPQMSPFASVKLKSWCAARFLPVILPPEKSHLGYKLWLDDLMVFWSKADTTSPCETKIMRLMANLASHNIGYIDWEPYIPFMFSKLTRFLNLACSCKWPLFQKYYMLDCRAMACWIVSVLGGGSSCQYYLDIFLKAIQTYDFLHKRSCWGDKDKQFLRSLTEAFMKRLRFERYKNVSWLHRTPESHKLTDEDIDRFVESTSGLWKNAVYSTINCPYFTTILRNLATLRPGMIIPFFVERFYSALNSLTEPSTLKSLMICMITMAKPMVEGAEKGYPEGPKHVIPMLMQALPGIDANDIPKSILTFEFISVFVSLVPIVDSSNAGEYYNDLTEEEEEICGTTASFEDFVSQFLYRIFNFIDSSTVEAAGIEKVLEQTSRLDSSISSVLSAVCLSVLSQCSTSIFMTALKKLQGFVTDRILETRVSGFYLARVCRSFSMVNPEETAKCLVPHLCNAILNLTESPDVQKEETLDKSLIYNMTILSEIFHTRRGSLPFMNEILAVFDRTLHLSCVNGVNIATTTLGNYLMCLTSTYPKEHRSLNCSYDLHVKDYLPIRDWGKKFHLRDINLEWQVPGPEEMGCVQDIVWKYLPVELERLEKHISDEEALSRNEVLNSLKIVYEILKGGLAYPSLDEEPLLLEESSVKTWSYYPVNFEMIGEVGMPDGKNIRRAIIETIDKLQMKILECTEDDPKSLNLIIMIWEKLFFDHFSDKYYQGIIESFSIIKKRLQDPLLEKMRQVRVLMIAKALHKHKERRGMDVPPLTETRRLILLNLMRLSCSYYSQVRKKAQATLSKVLSNYNSAYKILIPELLKNLQMDSVSNHEMFKGSLNVLLCPSSHPIIVQPDWDIYTKIWPAIIKSTPSEKNSIIALLGKLTRSVYENMSSLSLELAVPDQCVETAKKLWENSPVPSEPILTDDEIRGGIRKLNEKNKFNLEKYYESLNLVMDALGGSNLNWRYYELGIWFLYNLFQENVRYPARTVRIFLDALINDSPSLRRIVAKCVKNVLRQQQRPFKKVLVDLQTLSPEPLPETFTPGVRPDNLWLQFSWKSCPRTAEAWDELRYLHKIHVGYFQLPKVIELYAPSKDQPPLDRSLEEMTPEEREVEVFFSSRENLEKLIKYFSLEEKDLNENFKNDKEIIFKNLFKNHGDSFVELLKPHIQNSIDDETESNQRCGIEIIKGLILGSKHWPFEKVTRLWEFLSPVIKKGLSHASPETDIFWAECFKSTLNSRDPKRLHWLIDILMEYLLRDEASYRVATRLIMCYCFLAIQSWKSPEITTQILERVRPFLAHPFQNYREGIARLLGSIFRAETSFPNVNNSGPRICDFMKEILPGIEPLYSLQFSNDSNKNGLPDNKTELKDISDKLDNIKIGEGDNSTWNAFTDPKQKENSIRLFKTVALWIYYALHSTASEVKKEYYSVFPLLFIMESYDQDDEIPKICSDAMTWLARSTTDPELIPLVISSVWKVCQSGSFSARKSVLNFFKIFVVHNMFPIVKNPEWRKETSRIVLHMLEDERIEVREEAGLVLTILMYSGFIQDTGELFKCFTEKLRKKRKNNLKDSDYIRIRHSAILGLCSFILCSPYDISERVTEIFSILANHLHDTQPIPGTILKVLNSFKKTHPDWENHKKKFTEEELEVFNALVVPPSYFT